MGGAGRGEIALRLAGLPIWNSGLKPNPQSFCEMRFCAQLIQGLHCPQWTAYV